MRIVLSFLFGIITSREERRLFFYRRWASERLPYKSQDGQDWWVDQVLSRKRGGFFLDLAAADGVWISNTHFLEKQRNWNGICIEPNQEMFEKLCKARNVLCIKQCISDKQEIVSFRVDSGVVGGIVAADTDNKPNSDGKIVEMEAITLTELLDKNNAPQYIDYFSLDVEGAEDRVIRGLNFEKYKFGLITIERPSKYIDSTLKSHGYSQEKKIKQDVYYVGSILI
jgi:FkbM family methyltransferase